jgi:hypothetical protein
MQQILYSERIDELDPLRREAFEHHLVTCTACRDVQRSVVKADGMIARIKDTVPEIKHPKELTESILLAIANLPRNQRDESAMSIERIVDYLAAIFSTPAMRFACSLVLLVCGLSYTIMEYNDTQAIVLLEHKLGKDLRSVPGEANAFYGGANIVRLMNDVYNFSQNNLSYEELTDKLRFINKEDAQILTEEYRDLDKPIRARLDTLRNNFLTERDAELHVPRKAEEIHALRQEIKELRKVLESYIEKDIQP